MRAGGSRIVCAELPQRAWFDESEEGQLAAVVMRPRRSRLVFRNRGERESKLAAARQGSAVTEESECCQPRGNKNRCRSLGLREGYPNRYCERDERRKDEEQRAIQVKPPALFPVSHRD